LRIYIIVILKGEAFKETAYLFFHSNLDYFYFNSTSDSNW